MGSHEILPPISQSWTQTSKGTWSRPFTVWDNTFIAFMKHDPTYAAEGLMIISSTKIAARWSQTELVHRLKQAWRTMRYYSPIHGMQLDFENSQLIYKTPNAEEVEKWIDETFAIQEHATAQEVLRTILKGPKLVYCPQTGEVVYAICHLLSDGLGVVNFWQKFYEFVDVPEEVTFGHGHEHKFLAPSTEELLGCPAESTAELEQMARDFMARALPDMQASAKYTDQGLERSATESHSMCFTYNQNTTSNIIAACKSKGWSVTSAVSAAMAGAFFNRKDLQDPSATVLSTSSAWNYQPYIKPELVKAYPQINTATIFPMSVHKASFAAMADECNKFYKRGMVFDEFNMIQCADPYMNGMTQMTRTPRKELADAPSISSLGLIDGKLATEFDNFNIRDFRLSITMTLPGTVLHVWTFAGELCVNFSWQDAWTEEERMYSFAEEMRTMLLEGLGVKEE